MNDQEFDVVVQGIVDPPAVNTVGDVVLAISFASEALKASLVRGPVARTTALAPSATSAMSVTSRRTISMSGSASIRAVTSAENASRSTASAPPAGTACARATSKTDDPSASSSAFNMPAALSGFMLFNEFEQTSSAQFPVLCTSVWRSGRISNSVHAIPRFAS